MNSSTVNLHDAFVPSCLVGLAIETSLPEDATRDLLVAVLLDAGRVPATALMVVAAVTFYDAVAFARGCFMKCWSKASPMVLSLRFDASLRTAAPSFQAIGCLGAQLAISVHNCPVLADTRFPMSIFKRTQRKYVKKAYRVRNWREYEAGLRNRGSLTVWISLTAGKLVNWDAPRPRRRKPGRQRKYSNHAIETAVTLGMVFHLSSRQSEGLLRSLFALMKLDNDVPDHTTISRRKAKLGKVPFYQDKQKTPLHILIDSSGLAVHAGQLRRAQKSRDYRKLHLCVDEQSGEVVAGELTSKRARDSSRVASLVGQIDSPISSARADTAYDASDVYEAIENHSAHRSPRVLIPPRKGALLASGPASSRQRNRNIAAQARLGKRKWHTESGYSKRSKVETTFHRYKAIVGSAMRARGLAAQRVEARIGCKILNTMMPWCITLDNSKGISRLRFWAKNHRVNEINDLPVFMHQGSTSPNARGTPPHRPTR